MVLAVIATIVIEVMVMLDMNALDCAAGYPGRLTVELSAARADAWA